ncbi:MAG: helix-turn-helix domain-containing protein [Candidatus Micrarchaeota archaeon]|nr:helix-turn-helix domain-containing protein [Candidatus Micrarchaeota archaeon]
MTKKYLPVEKRIIAVLYSANKALNTNRIAELAEISRPTALHYLQQLQETGVLNAGKYKNAVYWWIANSEIIDRTKYKQPVKV